jgi:hypothetical protein
VATSLGTGLMLLRVPDAAGIARRRTAIKIIAFCSIKTNPRRACTGSDDSAK